jgi:hypothetical protein
MKNLWNIIGYIAMYGGTVKQIADHFLLTDVITAAISRYNNGPSVME